MDLLQAESRISKELSDVPGCSPCVHSGLSRRRRGGVELLQEARDGGEDHSDRRSLNYVRRQTPSSPTPSPGPRSECHRPTARKSDDCPAAVPFIRSPARNNPRGDRTDLWNWPARGLRRSDPDRCSVASGTRVGVSPRWHFKRRQSSRLRRWRSAKAEGAAPRVLDSKAPRDGGLLVHLR